MSVRRDLRRRARRYDQERRGRHDVQGLRALAVLAVVVDHLTGWPGGGFIGVDVFFVISGFLITGLLVREHGESGRISFVGFYRRRVKRIVPAALVVLLSTIVVGRFVLFEDRWREVVVDAGWSAGFLANWRFLSQQTDYFDATRPVSPLQHFWSLAVEEQFYLVWPVALLLVLLATRWWDRVRLVAPVVLVVVATAASFAYALRLTSDDLTSAYFSSPARAWELGVGATLALCVPVLNRLPSVLRPVLGWAGLATILTSIALVEPGRGFPAPWAALPVLGTAAVLAAGTRDDGVQQRLLPLTNPVSHYLGDISYSLYLWHFPVIVLADAWFGHGVGPYYPVVVVLVIALSVASYHLVEDPIRTSPWFEPYASHREKRRARHAWRSRYSGVYRDLGLALGALVAVAVAVAGLTRVPPVVADSVDYSGLAATGADRSVGAAGSPIQQALRADLEDALATDEWPQLQPSFDEVETEGRPLEAADCDLVDPTDPAQCAYGDPDDPALAVIGDSLAITLVPTLRAAYGDDYFIKVFPRPVCSFSVELVYPVAGFDDVCRAFLADSIDAVEQLRPVLTIFTETYGDVEAAKGASDLDEGLALWRAGKSDIVDRLRATGTHVVLLSPPPTGPSLQECATRTSEPDDCAYEVSDVHEAVADVERELERRDVDFVDTTPWFCASDRCPAFVGDTPLKRDYIHPTRQWAEKLAPVLASVFDKWLDRKAVVG